MSDVETGAHVPRVQRYIILFKAPGVNVQVGEGEFGTVHKAKWYGTIVAVKVLRRSDAVAVGDFRFASYISLGPWLNTLYPFCPKNSCHI